MSLADLLGESFLRSEYFQIALTHRSVSSNNNERLEYLGDSLLGFVVAEWLYSNFPDHAEGDLTRLRAYLVRKETLAEIAKEHDLGGQLVLGAGELKSGGVRRASILGDALEAVIGAVYLSEGFERAKTFVLDLYQSRMQNIPSIEHLKDAKTKLQEVMQSKGLALPVYSLKERTGKSGNEIFTMECKLELSEDKFIGSGSSRRKAEQAAAEHAYLFITQQLYR